MPINKFAIVSTKISLATNISTSSSLRLAIISIFLLLSLPIKSLYTEFPFSSNRTTFAALMILSNSAFHFNVKASVQGSPR